VEHSEGKDRESAMAILRFLYGSPRPFDRTVLAPMASLELCTDRMSDFMGPISRVAFVTTLSNCTSLLHVVLLLLEAK
jgi:hypothetical protein